LNPSAYSTRNSSPILTRTSGRAYQTAVTGSYYGYLVRKAREDGRLTKLAIDPLLPIKLFWDIGIQDATAIWVTQFIGERTRASKYKAA
jgi:phage terminase large subunit